MHKYQNNQELYKINQYISVMVGGAITINSNPLEEYQECLVKAEAMVDVLKNDK